MTKKYEDYYKFYDYGEANATVADAAAFNANWEDIDARIDALEDGTLELAGGTLTGDLVLDDGVGDSPSIKLVNQYDNYATMQFMNASGGELHIKASYGPICFMAGGDADDFVGIWTSANQPQVVFYGCDGLITANSGNISFDDENLSTSGNVQVGGILKGNATAKALHIDADNNGTADAHIVNDGTYNAVLFGTEDDPTQTTARGIRYSAGDLEYNDSGSWNDIGTGAGDMTKAEYDANDDGVIDDGALPMSDSTPAAIASSGSAGTGTSVSRDDHVHAGGFVDRGDPATVDYLEVGDKLVLNTNGAWHDLDLSAILPAGAKAVVLSVAVYDDAAGSYIMFRKNGNSNNYAVQAVTAHVSLITSRGSLTVACDSNRVIEYYASNVAFTSISITVTAWYL